MNNSNRDTSGFLNGSFDKHIEPGQLYVFGISIDKYHNFSHLSNAVKDLDCFVSILEKRYGFLKKNLICLTNEQATLENISQHFYQLIDQIKPEDSLIVYFSGHGTFEKKLNEGYWIPVDGKSNSVVSFVPNSLIIKWIESIQSLHTLLIVDSCFSGSLFGSVRNVNTVKKQLFGIPSRWVLTSGRNQPVEDGEQGKNSPFAESLLYHLGRNTNSTLGISDLYPLIIAQVGNNNEQIPRCEPIRNVGHKGGEFIFFLNGNVPPDFTILQPEFPTRRLSPDRKDKTIIRSALLGVGLIILILAGIYYSPQWFTYTAGDKKEANKIDNPVNDTQVDALDTQKNSASSLAKKDQPSTTSEAKETEKKNTTNTEKKTLVPQSQERQKKPEKENNGTIEPKVPEVIPEVDISCFTKLPGLSITIEVKGGPFTYKADERGEIRIRYPDSLKNEPAKISYTKKDGNQESRTITLNGGCFPIPDF